MTEAAVEAASLHRAEGYQEELVQLERFLRRWIDRSDAEIKPLLNWQFLGSSKYFRPVTVFACRQAMSPESVPETTVRAAVAIEMAHNVSLIIDDILDRSRHRRGVLTLHCRFGMLPALMASGYITAEAFELCRDNGFEIERLAELFKRLALAESLQWRVRREPLGVEDWRYIAGEDTGSMFEACACLGTGDERLRHYGRLLGTLYHGCDDVGDMRGAVALGGGGDQDLRDGILTLPAAIAIRDPRVATYFRNPSREAMEILLAKVSAALPAAEEYLDKIAAEAIAEANRVAPNPEPLVSLVTNTRQLSA
ncbi:MAG: polyprenyl synthetase family protein [Gammaproteobacteria bacterium]